jgi:hypothetical protein
MATIQLTDEQCRALSGEAGQPVDVVDPGTKQRYVLLVREQYDRVRDLLDQGNGPKTPEVATGIPPGILRSQQAFWRDLDQMLAQKKLRGSYVVYHLERRVGIARDAVELIRECNRRAIPDDECYLAQIRPRSLAPWEVEEIAVPLSWYGQVGLSNDPSEAPCE